MLATIVKSLTQSSYAIYQDLYRLNIVGVRSDTTVPNRFDDTIHVFYKDSSGRFAHHDYKATTDPGTYWLKNPMMAQGTAILAQGQYKDGYQIGMHRGKYFALVQRLPVTVIRDYDRNAVLDFYNGQRQTGMFGINIHKASASGTSVTVDHHSAGCQVIASAAHFSEFMRLCERHRNLYGNKFTYTLVDQRAIARTALREAAISVGAVGVAAGASLLTYHLLTQ